MSDVLLIEDAEAVRTLTLNRPHARNALNSELIHALRNAVDAAERDDSVNAVILTAADPAFCAGLDLREAEREGAAFFTSFRSVSPIEHVAGMTKPVLGAINGPAMTGGLELALACDFLIASEFAAFADTHAPVGVMPRSGLTIRLPAFVGYGRAIRMSMTSELVDADQAARIGLVTEVLPHRDLHPRAMELAVQIATPLGSTVRSIKRMYAKGEQTRLGPSRAVAEEIARAYEPDYEGLGRRRGAVLARNRAELEAREGTATT